MSRAPAAVAALVNLPAKHPKEVGHSLDLVQDYQAVGVELEIPPRVREAGGVSGVLEIEIHAVGGLRRDGTGERRLPDLARPEERQGRHLLKIPQDAPLVSSVNHPC